MKPGQYFSLIIGIMFLVVGIMGFIPAFVSSHAANPDDVNLALTVGYGNLLGIFPINILHNLVHLTVGILGIVASRTLGASRLFCGALAIFYGLLTVLGLFYPTQSMFGLVPIFGNDVWLHAGTAAIATYFGFFATPNLAELASAQDSQSLGSQS